MGFLDKVLSKVGTALTERYGRVASGKYEGCAIALGNPPTKKVSVAYVFSQFIFIKDDKEVARHNIDDVLDIKYMETIQFPATGKDGYRCQITFTDGDICNVDLFPSKARVFYNNTNDKMLNETQNFFEKEIKKSL